MQVEVLELMLAFDLLVLYNEEKSQRLVPLGNDYNVLVVVKINSKTTKVDPYYVPVSRNAKRGYNAS